MRSANVQGSHSEWFRVQGVALAGGLWHDQNVMRFTGEDVRRWNFNFRVSTSTDRVKCSLEIASLGPDQAYVRLRGHRTAGIRICRRCWDGCQGSSLIDTSNRTRRESRGSLRFCDCGPAWVRGTAQASVGLIDEIRCDPGELTRNDRLGLPGRGWGRLDEPGNGSFRG